jgi:hypothetical protein
MNSEYGLVGFKKDGQEYTIRDKDFTNALEKINDFYKKNSIENINEISDAIIWITEDELKKSKIKNKGYVKNINRGQYFMLFLEKYEPNKVKEEMFKIYDRFKEAIYAQSPGGREHLAFDDEDMTKQINSAFVEIDGILYLRFLNITDNTNNKFKIVLDLDKDLIEVTENNSIKTYDRTNIG